MTKSDNKLTKHIVVVQNTTLAENFGLSTYLRNITINLAKRKDLKITLICLRGEKNQTICPPNVDMYEVEGSTYSLKSNALFVWKVYFFLKKIHSKTPVSVVHCLYPNSSVAGAVLFKIFHGSVKVLYDLRSPWIHISVERGSIPRIIAPLYLFFGYMSEFLLSIFVDRFIFISDGLYEFYKSKLCLYKKKFIIIPSGIDLDFFSQKTIVNIRSKLGLSETDILIGYLGAVSSMRDLSFIIKAFAQIPNKGEGFKLAIVGEGDDRANLQQLAREYGLESRILFTGNVSQDVARTYLNAFDVGICHLPDLFVFRYSSPMKVLEYLATGIPVLASDIVAHQEIEKNFPQISLYKQDDILPKIIKQCRNKNKIIPHELISFDWKILLNKVILLY